MFMTIAPHSLDISIRLTMLKCVDAEADADQRADGSAACRSR